MHPSTHVALLLCVMLSAVAAHVSVFDDDVLDHRDRCWDRRNGTDIRVLPRNCPYDCCWGDECGSSTECHRVLIVSLAVGGAVLLCLIVGLILLYCYCTKKCCFARDEGRAEYTEPVQHHVVQGYPVQPQQQQQQHQGPAFAQP